MRILLGVCLAGVVGLWAWALLWHKPVHALPQDYVGEFVLDRELYSPPEGGAIPWDRPRRAIRPELESALARLIGPAPEKSR